MGQQIDSSKESEDSQQATERCTRAGGRKIRTVSIAVDTLDLEAHFQYCCKHAPKPSQSIGTDTLDLNQNQVLHVKTVCLNTEDVPDNKDYFSKMITSDVSSKGLNPETVPPNLCHIMLNTTENSLVESHVGNQESLGSLDRDNAYFKDQIIQSESQHQEMQSSQSDITESEKRCDAGSAGSVDYKKGVSDSLSGEEGEDEVGDEYFYIVENSEDMEDEEDEEEEEDEEYEECEEECAEEEEESNYRLTELTSVVKDSSGDDDSKPGITVQKTLEVLQDGVVIATSSIKETGASEEKEYHCCACESVFLHRYLIISHLRSHTELLAFQCVLCDVSTATENDARNHYQTHCKENLFKCKVCDLGFNSQKLLNHHTAVHSRQCMKCGKKFRTSSSLDKHLLTHSPHGTLPSENYSCSLCSESFASLLEYQRHDESRHATSSEDSKQASAGRKKNRKLMKGSRRWDCLTCGKPFRSSKALREHEVVHTGARDFPCNICGKAFGTAANMRIHRLTHSDKRPYSCQTCGATFRQKDSLKVHSRKHTGERPYVCSVCNMAFDRNFTLKNHLLTHAMVKSFVCAICGKAFTTRGGLNNHERLHSKDPNMKKDRKPRAKPGTGDWVCDECGKIYSTRSNLRMHQRTHQASQVLHPCPVCAKEYKSRDSMEVHMRRHTEERPYACLYCPRSFFRNYTLKLHVLTHTGEKPHRCPVEGCNKSFAQTSSLSYHVRNHKRQEERVCKHSPKAEDNESARLIDDFTFEGSASNHLSNEPLKVSLDEHKSMHGNTMDISEDMKMGINHSVHLIPQCVAGNIGLNSAPSDEGHVQNILGPTDHLSHHIQHTGSLVWDDSISMMNIVNNIQQGEPHLSIGHHATDLQLHENHRQHVQVSQVQALQSVQGVQPVDPAQSVQLMQLVPPESLPLLVSVPDGVLFHQDSTHKSESSVTLLDHDYVYNAQKVE